MQTYEAVINNLKQQKYAPLYFLYGEEAYYIDSVASYIEENALDPMAREFDQTVIYGKDYERNMAPVISAARRYPMMGQRQVIIVKEAQNIKSWEPLGLYLEQIMPTTVLVFCYKYGKPDKRQKVFKDFEKAGGVMMESAPLRDYQIQNWIRNYIKEWNQQKHQDITMSEDIVVLLSESLGTDLTKIVTALNKLVNGLPPDTKHITAELVQRNIGIDKDFNIFELQKALIEKDVVKANRIVNYFADSKQHAIQKEISMLYTFFSNLLIYQYLAPEDKNERTAASILGVNPYFIKDFAAASRKYSQGKVFHIIGYIRDIDCRSKGFNNPSVTEAELWKELIFKILH